MKKQKVGRRCSGFTLAETLLTVLILLLVSGIVATGVPVAENIYDKVVLGSNAQVLLSGAVTSLRYELGTATEVSISDDFTSISYVSAHTGAPSQIFLGGTGEGSSASDGIMLSEYEGRVTGRLVSKAAGGTNNTLGNMYVTYEYVNQVGDMVVFHNLAVYYQVGDAIGASSKLASLEDLSVRVIGNFAA